MRKYYSYKIIYKIKYAIITFYIFYKAIYNKIK